MKLKFFLLAGAASLVAGSASAGVIDNVRAGVMAHNICILECKNADIEDGININAEVQFGSPGFLEWAFEPKPYLMWSYNTDGGTSFGGGGLAWDFPISADWSFDPSLGYVIHDGDIENPFPFGTPAHYNYAQDPRLLLGSRDLFRTTFAFTWHGGDNWGAQMIYEHLSHGQIIGEGRNQGLDNLGVRFVWELD